MKCAHSRHSVFTVAMNIVVKIFSWFLVWHLKCLFPPRYSVMWGRSLCLEGLGKCKIMGIQVCIYPDPPPPIDSLCRPCPWEWTFFHRKCYYFSKSQRNWNDSVTACQEVEAQLVIVESDEEQVCLIGFFILGQAWLLSVKEMVGQKVFLVKGCLLHLERGWGECRNEEVPRTLWVDAPSSEHTWMLQKTPKIMSSVLV